MRILRGDRSDQPLLSHLSPGSGLLGKTNRMVPNPLKLGFRAPQQRGETVRLQQQQREFESLQTDQLDFACRKILHTPPEIILQRRAQPDCFFGGGKEQTAHGKNGMRMGEKAQQIQDMGENVQGSQSVNLLSSSGAFLAPAKRTTANRHHLIPIT